MVFSTYTSFEYNHLQTSGRIVCELDDSKNKKISNLPTDQIHDQENYNITGKGGIISFTENPSKLQNG